MTVGFILLFEKQDSEFSKHTLSKTEIKNVELHTTQKHKKYIKNKNELFLWF